MARKNEPYIYKVLRRETPNPRQQAFFRAEAANIAYGGARGGGKSWAMRRKLVLLAMSEDLRGRSGLRARALSVEARADSKSLPSR